MNISELLLKVDKPARYAGGEYNTPKMDKVAECRFCMCMPELYEVGMSNLGLKILYHVLNKEKNIICERCFAPALDFAQELRANKMPLMSIETKKPLLEFDIIGFSIQYELLYTNILYMLDLAGIPYRQADREDKHPLIIAGGPSAVNPEPYADFFDAIIIGEGEESLIKFTKLYIKHKQNGFCKKTFLKEAVKIEGVYVPSLSKSKIKKAVVVDFDNCYYPTNQIMPSLEAVHDRAMVELYRGCANGCRFCQAGFYYRPIRYRRADTIVKLCKDLIKNTGFDEISLGSLSTGDYPALIEVLDKLKPITQKRAVNLALPSLRLDSFKGEFSGEARKSSLTFAPEAGTERLRKVINKNVTQEDIEKAMNEAFLRGYRSVKLYFMIGLPTETQEDIDGIISTVKQIKYQYSKHHKGGLNISVSCAVFVPKPVTPFQWEEQISPEEMRKRQYYLKDALRMKGVSFHYHDSTTSILEAVFARGDRALSRVIEKAYKLGACFDGWTEHFNYDIWLKAFEEEGIKISEYTRARAIDEVLPWDFIDSGVKKEFLVKERAKAYSSDNTLSCNEGCNACGMTVYGSCNRWQA